MYLFYKGCFNQANNSAYNVPFISKTGKNEKKMGSAANYSVFCSIDVKKRMNQASVLR